MLGLLARSLLVWLGLVVLAILNGGLRERVLIPRVGEHVGHVVSTFLLGGIIVAAAWAAVPWLRLTTLRDAWLVGACWLAGTMAFEFLVGHWVFGHSWRRLLADYNVARGRIWILVLVATLLAPVIALRLRGP